MALSVNEANEVYLQVAEMAKSHGLEWVVAQAELDIALGRLRTEVVSAKEVPLQDKATEEVAHVSKGRPVKFIVSYKYSAQEKLAILLEALSIAVVGISETALAIGDFFSDQFPQMEGVEFAPDGISKREFSLNRMEIQKKARAAKHFDALIAELRAAI